jgi:hypothetical protein
MLSDHFFSQSGGKFRRGGSISLWENNKNKELSRLVMPGRRLENGWPWIEARLGQGFPDGMSRALLWRRSCLLL